MIDLAKKIEWFKKNWKWLLGILCTLGLFEFVRGIVGIMTNKKLDQLEEQKMDVMEHAGEVGIEETKLAGDTRADSMKNAQSKADKALDNAEKEKQVREHDLVDEPSKIDKELNQFGISERK